ncbi:unnamed protein product, partial [Scytosiphon promiscuus]
GKYAETEPLYERSQAILEVLGPEHPDVASSLNNRRAGPLYERSLAIREKVYGPDHPAVATALNNRAGLLKSQGKYEEAEPLYRRSLAIDEKVYGPDHPEVATDLNNWARLSLKHDLLTLPTYIQGKYDEAGPLYERSLTIREKAYGPDHPEVATALNNWAVVLQEQGKYDDAESLYERSQAIREKVLGPEHPDVAESLNNRAVVLEEQVRALRCL